MAYFLHHGSTNQLLYSLLYFQFKHICRTSYPNYVLYILERLALIWIANPNHSCQNDLESKNYIHSDCNCLSVYLEGFVYEVSTHFLNVDVYNVSLCLICTPVILPLVHVCVPALFKCLHYIKSSFTVLVSINCYKCI